MFAAKLLTHMMLGCLGTQVSPLTARTDTRVVSPLTNHVRVGWSWCSLRQTGRSTLGWGFSQLLSLTCSQKEMTEAEVRSLLREVAVFYSLCVDSIGCSTRPTTVT